MKKNPKGFSRLWLLLPFVAGLAGYYIYYFCRPDPLRMPELLLQTLYSAVRQYAFSFDADPKVLQGMAEREPWHWGTLALLEIGRWSGMIVSANLILRVLKNIFASLRAGRTASRRDAVALHGSEGLKKQLSGALAVPTVAEELPEAFGTSRQVIAFDTDEDAAAYARAHYEELNGAEGAGRQVFLCLRGAPESTALSRGFTVVNMTDLCAREYWEKHPLRRDGENPEDRVAVIGFGEYGKRILIRGLLKNIYPRGCGGVAYDVYGADESDPEAKLLRERLRRSVAAEEGQDSLTFHAEYMGLTLADLEDADRVILCLDSEEENLRALRSLSECGSRKGLYVRASGLQTAQMLYPDLADRLDAPGSGVTLFGTDEELYTENAVLKQSFMDRACMIAARYRWRELDRKGQAPSTSEPVGAALRDYALKDPGFRDYWRALPSVYRESNVAAADHISVKVRALLGRDVPLNAKTLKKAADRIRQLEMDPEEQDLFLELEHCRWMRFFFLRGWEYAPVRDNAAKRHDCLKPFDQLTREVKEYDWDSYEAIRSLVGAEE